MSTALSNRPVRAVLAVLALLVAALGATLAVSSAPAGALDEPVDIRVEMDLPYCCDASGPVVFEVQDVVPGAGVELDGATHLVANPSGWVGTLSVDIDPDAQTIRVFSDDPADFQTATVTITSTTLASITLVSDDLWAGSTAMALTGASVTGGVATIAWSTADDDTQAYDATGQAVFSYELAQPAAELAVSPASGTVGEPVTISGTGCVGGEVAVAVSLDGEELATIAVTPDAEGVWSDELDTSALAAGTYVVAATCTGGQTPIEYEPVTFVLAAAPTTTTTTAPTTTTTPTTPTTTPAPARPAQAVTGSPSYTG